MAQTYDPQIIEPKWQQKWNEQKAFHTGEDHSKPKFYGLLEFPYPSGQGLHVGHPRPCTAMDIIARKRRMEATTFCSPSAGMLLACPPKITPSKRASILPSLPSRTLPVSAGSSSGWVSPLIMTGRWIPPIRPITSGPSGSF